MTATMSAGYERQRSTAQKKRVVIAGILVAVALIRADTGRDETLVEPSAAYDYQPGWTFVSKAA